MRALVCVFNVNVTTRWDRCKEESEIEREGESGRAWRRKL